MPTSQVQMKTEEQGRTLATKRKNIKKYAGSQLKGLAVAGKAATAAGYHGTCLTVIAQSADFANICMRTVAYCAHKHACTHAHMPVPRMHPTCADGSG